MAAYSSAEEIYQLRLSGKSPIEIAQILQIPHPDDVYRVLSERYAHEASFLSDTERHSLLALQLGRLDALLSALWPAAMMGDPKSSAEARANVQAQAKIAGLEQVDPVVNKNLVLVMGEKEEDYIKALKEAGRE